MPAKLPGAVDHIEQIGSFFDVAILGVTSTWTDVSGLSIDVGVVEQQVVTEKGQTVTIKVMGTTNYGDITLKRNLSADRKFYEWVQEVIKGTMGFRKDGSITLYNAAGELTGTWKFTNAWPKKWSASDLDVGSDDPMVEEVTLAIESLKRVQ